MATNCYELVRGSVIRVTGLDRQGRIPSPIRYAVSKSVAKVTIDEVTEPGDNEMLRSEDDERRLLFVRPTQIIRHQTGIDFLRVDPGVLSLVAGVPVILNANGDVAGFDSQTKRPPVAFAMEVWTRLTERCADGSRQWGYTLFPFLKGGSLTGFSFANGLVSFNLTGAQTRRYSRWGYGPYDIDGQFMRLLDPVSGNVSWHQTLVTGAPPAPTDGIVEFDDVIEGGTATVTTGDVLDGQFVVTSPRVLDGGVA